LDSANRSFLTLAALALSLCALLLCGGVGGVLAPLLVHDLSPGQAPGLPGGASLLPLLVFAASLTLSLGLGTRSLVRGALVSRRLATRVRAHARRAPDGLKRTAREAGLDGRVVFVDLAEPFSFAYGIFTPRVVVSRGLAERAFHRELHAVLAHERYHVRNLDPLKAMLARALVAALFFLPALDPLRVRYLAACELAADREAVRVCGRGPLAGALLKVVRGPRWHELDMATPVGHPELLDARVLQLETGVEPNCKSPLDARRMALSLAGAGSIGAVFLAAVSGLGGSAALHGTIGAGLARALVLNGAACLAPYVAAGLLLYLVIAARAARPLRSRIS
jgi:Zn-dependent protease with chaperone function